MKTDKLFDIHTLMTIDPKEYIQILDDMNSEEFDAFKLKYAGLPEGLMKDVTLKMMDSCSLNELEIPKIGIFFSNDVPKSLLSDIISNPRCSWEPELDTQ